MLIPGQIISLATFPGVIVHEMAHQFFCRISRVAVFDVCYFRFANPCGYVVHEEPKKVYQHVLISIGPFIINTILGALIAMSAAIPVLRFNSGDFLDFFLIWLGISIAMHAFPSRGDANNIWELIKSNETNWLTKIICFPIVVLIYIGALGSVVWLDLLYGMAVALLIPNLLLKILA
ncbi:metalloprotease family protein [Vallitalea guaymasensis]|uniref:DUF3267 domain-containing protein n=1 Tax=Vallitalea guaymasensis TaxID=1185412 RepID=A0A8J8MBY5_9FIRM|nr:metalloprotease family protein [Vallitalea guaymasensis]QUH29968.1 DUF3267 domain-containing protein [Vallitalea guaymasensis]